MPVKVISFCGARHVDQDALDRAIAGSGGGSFNRYSATAVRDDLAKHGGAIVYYATRTIYDRFTFRPRPGDRFKVATDRAEIDAAAVVDGPRHPGEYLLLERLHGWRYEATSFSGHLCV